MEPQESNVVDLSEKLEEQHLAKEHQLVKVQAYIKDPEKAEKKTANAARVEKFREKQREAGLVQTYIPAEMAEAIKAAGSIEAWLDQLKDEPPREIQKIVEVEKPVEIVREVVKIEKVEIEKHLTDDQAELIALGKKVKGLSKVRRWLAGI